MRGVQVSAHERSAVRLAGSTCPKRFAMGQISARARGSSKRLLLLEVETRKALRRGGTSAAYVQSLLGFVEVSMWEGSVAISGVLSEQNSAGE